MTCFPPKYYIFKKIVKKFCPTPPVVHYYKFPTPVPSAQVTLLLRPRFQTPRLYHVIRNTNTTQTQTQHIKTSILWVSTLKLSQLTGFYPMPEAYGPLHPGSAYSSSVSVILSYQMVCQSWIPKTISCHGTVRPRNSDPLRMMVWPVRQVAVKMQQYSSGEISTKPGLPNMNINWFKKCCTLTKNTLRCYNYQDK